MFNELIHMRQVTIDTPRAIAANVRPQFCHETRDESTCLAPLRLSAPTSSSFTMKGAAPRTVQNAKLQTPGYDRQPGGAFCAQFLQISVDDRLDRAKFTVPRERSHGTDELAAGTRGCRIRP